MIMQNLPKSVFISHGGGPLPLLGDSRHKEMVAALKELGKTLPRPQSILVISAHWEEKIPSVTTSAKPEMIYDYYGFPAESYEIKYPCSGNPDLAENILSRLKDRNIKSRPDSERGIDHGAYVPLKIMYPDADIPVVQMSMLSTLDPLQHIESGKALQGLNEQGVLVIGSGFSFHNMQAFFAQGNEETRKMNAGFEQWVFDVCHNPDYSESQRQSMLCNWELAPGARYCHPREEHLLPLHVCYGAAQSASSQRIEMNILDKKSSIHIW